jgi:hypothetical protein
MCIAVHLDIPLDKITVCGPLERALGYLLAAQVVDLKLIGILFVRTPNAKSRAEFFAAFCLGARTKSTKLGRKSV